MTPSTYLGNADATAIEALYERYRQDPESVDFGWRKFFEGFEFSKANFEASQGAMAVEDMPKEFRVINLINGYRQRGHLFTKTNPVRERRKYLPTLDLENFDLSEGDLDTVFQAGTQIGLGPAKLRDIVNHLKQTYCQSIGVEYTYIRKPEVANWLREKMEPVRNTPNLTAFEKTHILGKLNEAVVFENFLHTKYVGQKRFSLEGAETLIPALDSVIEKGAELGIRAFVIGMAHRGRLNVLANIMGKTYSEIFNEFEGKEFDDDSLFDGDVKYHLGFSGDVITRGGKTVHLTMSPNPSHLEAVDPVVQGIARAKLERKFEMDENRIAPILIHGDASIAGQGIVYEVVQMAQLSGYRTGGTIHIVINNQVGFTTNYLDARSSTYCTDVGKVTLCPVFHVNGDDVESLVYTINLAMEYRQTFHGDVFIDLLCYRKHGHNEGDEPRFTQPLLYKAIAKHPDPRKIYIEKLKSSKAMEDTRLASQMESEFKDMLEEKLNEAKSGTNGNRLSFLEGDWKGIRPAKEEDFDKSPNTGVKKTELKSIADKINNLPKDMKFFKKIERIMSDRRDMISKNKLDWGMCELLAYGSLVSEGFPVRISGQDVERGTFSHRHAVVRLEDSEEQYIPLANLSDKQAKFSIYNSLLSEYGVLGFEYGYALASPNTLTVWEAQFGDFFNGAQIIIDQFLSSAEDKWKKHNGLVLYLPHGYEGMGAEHSSARLERFLSLCAELNMQVVNCTTPANFFHVIRRQLHRDFRKPLVIFTPKKLLRYPSCVSTLDELSKGSFQEVIDDVKADEDVVTSVVFCQGKFYYDLEEERQSLGVKTVAIVRLEQMYPYPEKQISALLKKYKKAKDYIWAQEEPENMGAWPFIIHKFKSGDIRCMCQPESGSPATGSYHKYEKRHRAIIDAVFKGHKKNIELGVD
ncbi:MAG: 2-oxoglutarate dehydrogenase E1 component [Flavobacteriales bacterium]|nr:2-oxoglutarate dehydrogenase E1 component [Flavobacteriales bacterium]